MFGQLLSDDFEPLLSAVDFHNEFDSNSGIESII